MRRTLFAILLLTAFPLWADSPDHYHLGLTNYLATDYDWAVKYLGLALQDDPNDWKAHQLLGFCDFRLGDEEGALAECEKSLKAHGNNPRLENFIKWLKTPKPRVERSLDDGTYIEGRTEAKMPRSPDLDSNPTPRVPGLEPPDQFADVLHHFSFQLGMGSEFQGQNFKTLKRDSGYGGELGIGYHLDERWSFWLTQNLYEYDYDIDKNYTLNDRFPESFYEISISARYKVPMDNFKPYLFVGGGIFSGVYEFYDIYTVPGVFNQSTVVPMIVGGLGVEYSFDKHLGLFFEAKGNIIFPDSHPYQLTGLPLAQTITAIDYPVNVGIVYNP